MTELMNKNKKHTKHLDTYRHVSLAEIYLHYPYKWWDVNSTTIPRKPYVPKKDISDHKYKLDFKTWKLIVLTYMEELFEFLLSGDTFTIPLNMGLLKMTKYKYDYPNKNENLYKWCRKFTDGYFFKLVWINKGKFNIRLKNKSWFKLRLTQTKYKKIQKLIEKDRSIIYRFSTYRGYNKI